MAKPRGVAVALVALVALQLPALSRPSSADGPQALRTSYTVLSRTGGSIRIAALEWLPYRARTVLLAVHGLGAVKDNTFGRLAVPGYSLAEHAYDTGRATVAIDLPGVGESEGNPYVAGLEDAAFVVDQVADLLRARFEHVVGVGHSLGAAVVAVAQGLFTSFDAIVPAAYSHGGPPAKDECSSRPGVGIRKTLFTSYADPRVVEDFARWLRPPKATFALAVQELGPFEDDVTATITVPILIVLGGNDCVFDRSRYGEEPSHYPMAKDVRLVVLPRTGHAVFHHLDHRRVDRLVATWLTQHRL